MTSIIQSNRERKSRLDEGLVERLNSGIIENTQQPDPPKSSDRLRFITDEKEYEQIRTYLCTCFPKEVSERLIYKDGVMTGSSTYAAIGVNMYLRSINSEFRVAKISELTADLDFCKGHDIDVGIALRRNSTDDAANDVADFVRQSFDIKEKNKSIWIDIAGIGMGRQLKFVPIDSSYSYLIAPLLDWNDMTRFSQADIDIYGLPCRFDKNGQRTVYTSKSSLTRCILDENANINTKYTLGSLYTTSRIVLARQHL